jgi:hypothetical protein
MGCVKVERVVVVVVVPGACDVTSEAQLVFHPMWHALPHNTSFRPSALDSRRVYSAFCAASQMSFEVVPAVESLACRLAVCVRAHEACPFPLVP